MHAQNKFFSAIASAVLIFTPLCLSAQSWQENMKEAKQLYINKMYQNAQMLFQRAASGIKSQGGSSEQNLSQAEGYSLLCALKLAQEGSQRQAFSYIRKYPTSLLNPSIKFEAASLYFSDGDFSRALVLMEDLQPTDIEVADRQRYLLQKGICLCKENRSVEAENHLLEIPKTSSLYSQARYWLGYSEYTKGNFADAIGYFEESGSPSAAMMLSDCHFMLKDYGYVYEHSSDLNSYEGAEKARLARIVSESADALGKTSEAERYFRIYSDQKELSKTDNFYSGMLAYQQGNWREAERLFEECINFGDNDSLSQNALYRLARCKIEEKDKLSAADAFQKASQMDFNQQIKEDAFFNYAKLSFELWGNADRLYQYLQSYAPADNKKDETYGHIAAKCLEDNKFQDAIEALEKIASPTGTDLSNLQKAGFFQGMALMEEGRFIPAEEYLREASLKKDINPQIAGLAAYWLAESLFRQQRYEESLDILTGLQADKAFAQTGEYKTSFFNSGYDRLRLKDIDGAYKDFAKYTGMVGMSEYGVEAMLRMADCKFMQRDFKAAQQLYSDVASKNAGSTLYAPLQEALAQGLLGNNKKKIDVLKAYSSDSYKSSEKFTELLYELGRAQIQQKDSKGAEKTLLRLTQNPADSLFYGKALMELGMLYTNSANNAKAKDCYRRAATANLSEEETQAAMNAYQNLCNQEGNPDEFHSWISSLASSEKVLPKGSEEKAQLLFNSAEQIFLAEKYAAAADAFEKFIAQYPESNKSKAWYYLAQSYSQTGSYSNAAEAFSYLAELSVLPGEKAAFVMRETEMRFKARQYNKIIEKTSSYMGELQFEDADSRQLKYWLAKSYLAEEDSGKAVDLLLDVAEDVQDEIGAEAAYLLVKDSFDRGKFERVEKMVFALAEEKTQQMYYLAKCYILLGDSYFELEDYEQAAAVYGSIYDSYSGDAQIRRQALEKKTQAEQKMKK